MKVIQRYGKWVVIDDQGNERGTADSKGQAEAVARNYAKAKAAGEHPPIRHANKGS